MDPISEDNASTTDEDESLYINCSKNAMSTINANLSSNRMESTRMKKKIPSLSHVAKSISFSDLKYR